MKFIVLKENLGKVLSILGRNIPTRPQLPILANILLEAEKDWLKLSVTNLEIGLFFQIPARVETEGKTTISGKLFSEFISNLKTNKIEFFLEKDNLLIKSDYTKANFSTIPSNDFPVFPKIPEAKEKINFEKIKEAITRVAFAASNDEGRPVLTGVRFFSTKDKITLTATDGYRLSFETLNIPFKEEDFQIIIPAFVLLEITRIVSELKEETVSFSLIEEKNQAVFTFHNGAIFTRLIEGQFPKIEGIIPQGGKTKVIVEKDQLIGSLKTVSLFARTSANIVKIKIEKKGLRLSAASPQLGSDEDFVEADVQGEEMEIAFNYRFLLELLNNFPDKNLVFEASGPLNAGLFKPLSSTPSFLHVIMPVRIQE